MDQDSISQDDSFEQELRSQAWHDAVQDGNLDQIEKLLESGTDVNTSSQGLPGIIQSVINGNIEVVQFLIEKGVNVNQLESYNGNAGGWTALHYAAESGNMNLVRLLLENGADPTQADISGMTPYDSAKIQRLKSDYRELLRLLKSKGGRPGRENLILVTGAGFTKGLFGDAPLVIDNFRVKEDLLPKYAQFAIARTILEAELNQQKFEDEQRYKDGLDRGNVNLERLMTRLNSGMPYDNSQDTLVRRALLTDLRQQFVQRIHKMRRNTQAHHHLKLFALQCFSTNRAVLTFNYDDLMDEAFFRASNKERDQSWDWHPNNGYGFQCRDARVTIGFSNDMRGKGSPVILKLHGSINWKVRAGATPPYRVEDFVHHIENWNDRNLSLHQKLGSEGIVSNINRIYYEEQIEQHLEPDPFIVPPVLTKSELTEQPLLRLIWSQASDFLRQADKVIFVGYSLPITDIASVTMFRESLSDLYPDLLEIEVVDYKNENDLIGRDKLKEAYRQIFHGLPDEAFQFDGAAAWLKDFTSRVDPGDLQPTEIETVSV